MAWRVYRKHSLLCETVPLFPGPYPGVRRFRRREPGLRQLGTVAYQGKALAIEGHTNRGVNTNHRMTSHLCDPTRLRAETRRTQGLPVPRGGFHKAGEGPAFGDSFPHFSSGRNGAQRSVPGGALVSAEEIGEATLLPKKKEEAHSFLLLLFLNGDVYPVDLHPVLGTDQNVLHPVNDPGGH